jgi:hypothetical protein
VPPADEDRRAAHTFSQPELIIAASARSHVFTSLDEFSSGSDLTPGSSRRSHVICMNCAARVRRVRILALKILTPDRKAVTIRANLLGDGRCGLVNLAYF